MITKAKLERDARRCLAEWKQYKVDVDSFNEHRCPDKPIPYGLDIDAMIAYYEQVVRVIASTPEGCRIELPVAPPSVAAEMLAYEAAGKRREV